ncbi:MAG: hypothetical protein NT157_04115 [Candidatus Micrarchaeota archaeon]|nr:hypothetical protein [Candidatus Micrarchaeota archaeon]
MDFGGIAVQVQKPARRDLGYGPAGRERPHSARMIEEGSGRREKGATDRTRMDTWQDFFFMYFKTEKGPELQLRSGVKKREDIDRAKRLIKLFNSIAGDSKLRKAGVATERRDYPEDGKTVAIITCKDADMQQFLSGMFGMVYSGKLTAEHAFRNIKNIVDDVKLIEALTIAKNTPVGLGPL